MRDAHDLTVFKPDFYYEPRVLWGAIGLYRDDDGRTRLLQPGRDDYYNGSRWPIVLTKVIALAMHPTGYPESASHFIGKLPIEIGLSGGSRYSLGEIAPAFAARAMGTAREPLDYLNDAPALMSMGTALALTPNTRTRDVQNTVRWDFDHPCVLPPAALMEVTLSGRVPTLVPTSTTPVEIDTNFFAAAPGEGANFPGSAYVKQRSVMPQLTNSAAAQRFQGLFGANAGGGEGSFPDGPFDGFAGGAETKVYPPELTFTAKQMVDQKATFVMPTQLRGLGWTIDQRALDDEVLYTAGSPLPGSLLCTTLGRVRSRNGGTSAYWWRDGLPLAAACPTQTPGLVSDLARPITLQPNEGLRVTLPNLSLHDIALPTVTPDQQTVRPQGIVYLSFTGYAVVEA